MLLRIATRALHTPAVSTPVRAASIRTPTEFLTAIGRSSEKKVKAETWEALWKLKGEDLKKAGVTVRDRRYVLWAIDKFKAGGDPESFAYVPSPKKKFRGWGPCVQHGKRIR